MPQGFVDHFAAPQLLGMLAVLGILACAAWLLARRRGGAHAMLKGRQRADMGRMRVLSVLSLGPGQRLVQVQLLPDEGRRIPGPDVRLLLGVGAQHITCLHVLGDGAHGVLPVLNTVFQETMVQEAA